MGGPVSLQGVPERAPVRVSVPQVWRHTGAEAAVAALVAHARMGRTGEAQFVDVSAQSAMTWTMLNGMGAAAIQGHDFERMGPLLQLGSDRAGPPAQDVEVAQVVAAVLVHRRGARAGAAAGVVF